MNSSREGGRVIFQFSDESSGGDIGKELVALKRKPIKSSEGVKEKNHGDRKLELKFFKGIPRCTPLELTDCCLYEKSRKLGYDTVRFYTSSRTAKP